MGSLARFTAEERPMAKDIQALSNRGVRIDHTVQGRLLAVVMAQSSLMGQVKACQYEDPRLARLRDRVQNGGVKSFSIDDEGVLRCHGRLCIPMVGNVKQLILEEAHSSRYSIHPGATKMYQDLRGLYRWKGMKADILKHMTSFLNCQQWDDQLPLAEFAYNNSYQSSIQMAPFEALYGRRCRSPVGWFELGEAQLLGPDLVQQALENVALIRERLQTAQSRQKSYADKKVRDTEFMKGEKVFLKVSPMKGVMRFGRKGKLSPRYIGPYEILDRNGLVAYRLALPPRLSAVHPVFHVSMLRRYVGDDSHKIQPEDVELDENLTHEEGPISILDRQVRQLRSKKVASVKVLWRNHPTEEATWESETDMRDKYPHLFDATGMI
ncbi:uncharacterized protein LOC132639651 [Lycium barbarum]|uniref:uncharacterized protein LOC132639651 n=1 Tax=Lycium barbarum TaxID=112863 RepID=UPI00293EE528|nr:uncharacterized protein LOC132639651 [Lycium barbarum]